MTLLTVTNMSAAVRTADSRLAHHTTDVTSTNEYPTVHAAPAWHCNRESLLIVWQNCICRADEKSHFKADLFRRVHGMVSIVDRDTDSAGGVVNNCNRGSGDGSEAPRPGIDVGGRAHPTPFSSTPPHLH